MPVNLTDRYIQSLPPAPAGTRIEIWDMQCPVLGVRISEEYELQFRDAVEAAFPVAVIEAAFSREVMPLW